MSFESLDQLRKELEDLTDEFDIITYKWLSKKLGIHCNLSKKLLSDYATDASNENKFSPTYLLEGRKKESENQMILIASENDLDEVNKLFSELTSKHVYSLQRCKKLIDLNTLYIAEKVNRETIRSISSIKYPATTKLCKIIKNETDVKTVGSEHVSNKVEEPVKVGTPQKKSNAKVEPLKSSNLENTVHSQVQQQPKNKDSKSSNLISENKTTKPSTNSLSALFAKGSNKKPVKPLSDGISPKKISKTDIVEEGESKEIRENDATKPSPKSLSALFAKGSNRKTPKQTPKAISPKKVAEIDGEKYEEDELNGKELITEGEKISTEKKKPKKKSKKHASSEKKQRKRIVVQSDSSDSEEERLEPEYESEPEPLPPPPLSMPEESSGEGCVVSKGRAKKRTSKETTVMDSEGFLITTIEVDYVSCSEEENSDKDNGCKRIKLSENPKEKSAKDSEKPKEKSTKDSEKPKEKLAKVSEKPKEKSTKDSEKPKEKSPRDSEKSADAKKKSVSKISPTDKTKQASIMSFFTKPKPK